MSGILSFKSSTNLIIPQININSSPPPKQNQHPALFRFLLQRKRTKGFHNQARVKTLNFLTQDGIKIESSRTITYLSSRRDEITSPCDLSGNTRVQFSANEVFLRSVICSFYKTNTFSSILGVGVDGKNPQSWVWVLGSYLALVFILSSRALCINILLKILLLIW